MPLDGRSLLFNEVHGTNTNLYKMDVASGRMEALTQRTGTLRVQGFSRDRTQVAYTFDDFDSPADLYASDVNGDRTVRLTDANPRDAFEPDLIVYTGLGYAVLGPNVRGSSGYIIRGLIGSVGDGE
jgi:dipeptidyl aminopeptidase/acylaminoacyl peptidase